MVGGPRGGPRAARARGADLSRLLFDTTYLVDADRSRGAIDEDVSDGDDVAIAAITVAELRVGVELATGRARVARRAFVEDLMAVVQVLPYDVAVAEAHATLLAELRRQGRPRGAHDLLIAATAAATGRMVVTADGRAFEDLPGVAVLRHR